MIFLLKGHSRHVQQWHKYNKIQLCTKEDRNIYRLEMAFSCCFRGCQLSSGPFSVTQNSFVYALLKECDHMLLRALDIVWVTEFQKVLDIVSSANKAVHLWWDHSGTIMPVVSSQSDIILRTTWSPCVYLSVWKTWLALCVGVKM